MGRSPVISWSGPLVVLAGVALAAIVTACSPAGPESQSASESSSGRRTSSVVATDPAPDNPFRTGRTLVIAHSGGDGLFPENTMLAYERSTQLGSDVIDVDVRLTADGVLVAIHDSNVGRTTNGTGAVKDFTFDEIQRLDAGYRWQHGEEFPYRGEGIVVPSVEAILDRFPTMLATLDLKDQRVELVEPVCELLRRMDRVESVYVGSDSGDQVRRFREVCPELRTSGTDEERQLMRAARDAGDMSFVTHQLVGQPRYLSDDGTKRITAEYLKFSHRMGIAVLTWVVDDPEQLRELISLGVDGVYTRRPDVMIDLLTEMGLR